VNSRTLSGQCRTLAVNSPATGSRASVKDGRFWGGGDRIPEFGREVADQFIGVTNAVDRV